MGRKVELVFDPFDLEEVTVRYMDTDFGRAVPHRIGRHTHPMARPQPGPGPRTGIDYLRLLDERHRADVAKDIAPLRFAELSEAADSEVKENDR